MRGMFFIATMINAIKLRFNLLNVETNHKSKAQAQVQAQSTSTSTSTKHKNKKYICTIISFTYGRPTLFLYGVTSCFLFQVCLHYEEGVKGELPRICPVDRSTDTAGIMPPKNSPWMPKSGYE